MTQCWACFRTWASTSPRHALRFARWRAAIAFKYTKAVAVVFISMEITEREHMVLTVTPPNLVNPNKGALTANLAAITRAAVHGDQSSLPRMVSG